MAFIIYKRQRQILDFLQQYIEKNGSAPTLREIAKALGVSSIATVHEHLEALQKKGLIKRKDGKTRAIEINFTRPQSMDESGITIPVMGFIAAGRPLEPYTDPNATVSIPPSFISGTKRTFVLQVRGESMIDDGIYDGDYVVIEQREDALDGDIVVALLDNGMATLKRYFKEQTRVRLEPANAKMSPIFVRGVRIQGKVVGLIRRYS